MLPLCSAIAGLSPGHARLCQSSYGLPDPCLVLPTPFEGPPAGEAPPQRPDAVTFGFAGRLEGLKGPQILLDAFAQVVKRFPGVRLRLAGNGPEQEQLEAQARRLGISSRCDFAGAYTTASGKRDFLCGVDVLVHPSFAEGVPNSIIEAMAYARPVVASAVGGVPDMVTPENGLLVPPGDPYALAEAMISPGLGHPAARADGPSRAAALRVSLCPRRP